VVRALFRLALGAVLALAALPAQAAITVTFWSHELGNSFPHAFLTFRGVPDAGGEPVDTNIGFTARTVSPAILFGPVPGKYDVAKPGYVAQSDAQFSLVLTDAQYADLRRLVDEWGEKGDQTYSLKSRNCVHFVAEAARRLGLAGVDQPKLMRKPRSYLLAVAAANPGRVTVIHASGKAYLATLAPLATGPVTTTAPAR
jgi:hypothetical protein